MLEIGSVKLRIFSYPSISTVVLGAQKNRLNETGLMSYHNSFCLRNQKVNFSNTLFYLKASQYFMKLLTDHT